jgi:hypothetical protein
MIPDLSTKTTAREEWSYIYIVLRELMSMGWDKFSTISTAFSSKKE